MAGLVFSTGLSWLPTPPRAAQDRLGVDDSARDYLPFPDLEQSVRDDLATVRNSPLIPKDIPVTGGIYDVKTGKITLVE